MDNRTSRIRILASAGLVLVLAGRAAAQASGDPLANGFKQPPDSAKPRAWWHWMNGNVTEEGITADLEWMERAGIGGMQMFDGDVATPRFVEKRLAWMTPEWKAALRHAAAEADRLGLEMAMASSGGWSESGGPFVRPEQAMKKVVWSETEVGGPRKFSGVLPHPPTVNGLFQNIPRPKPFRLPADITLPEARLVPEAPPSPDQTYYADTKVIAFRVPDGEVRMMDLHPKLTTSAGDIDLSPLTDGDLSKTIEIPFLERTNRQWIQIEFDRPFKAQSFTFAGPGGGQFTGPAVPQGVVQASQDGNAWATLVNLPGPGHPFAGFPVRTYSFPETTARFFRVVMDPPKPNRLAERLGLPSRRVINVAELELTSTPRVNHWQEKAQFGNMVEYESAATPEVSAGQAIPLSSVLDLTARMRKDGVLDWEVPAGRWVVLRMGYSLTGQKNAPASPEATGHEVDKLSRKDVEAYFQNYVSQISGALGPFFGKSFRYFLMDSYEAGMENWTELMLSEFQKRRGYDATPYLPVLTGRVVESADVSDRFLWDFRRTLADLFADNYYGAATEYFKKYGVGLYAEAMGTGEPTTGDGLQDKSRVTIPMGEFWTPLPGVTDNPDHFADVKETASAAHIFGKNLAAAESFSSWMDVPMWGESPFYLKPIADHAFALGINRIVLHESAAQPFVDDKHKPGMTLGPFGQNFTRNITWASQAVAWNTYLARCSYMLQQGLFVGDLAYFYGEGAPVTVPFWKQVHPAPPPGYDYDWIDTQALNLMTVKDGRLVLPDGMSYAALVLPEDVTRLTVPVVRKIRDLVGAGGTVIAPRPGQSPSLNSYPSADREIRFIANDVWGPIDGKSITEHDYGKGKVYWGRPLEEVLAAARVPPDFEYNRPRVDTRLVWIHRRTADADIYFVANQKPRLEDVETSFRAEGKSAELWYPDTGRIEPAGYKFENGRTIVRLHLDPDGSVFVVFRGKASEPSRTLPHPVSIELMTLDGPWDVSFPPNWGAPAHIRLDRLASWTACPDEGVKYFSGTATYSKDIQVPEEWLRSGARLVLDLGEVKEIAQVSVRGKALENVLWKPPFQVDVTDVLKVETNRLEIKVTNLWPNRLIGDAQPGAARTYTFTDYRFYKSTSSLLESGLLGPVRLFKVTAR